jgi:hypothetical protein
MDDRSDTESRAEASTRLTTRQTGKTERVSSAEVFLGRLSARSLC